MYPKSKWTFDKTSPYKGGLLQTFIKSKINVVPFRNGKIMFIFF
jgi:hypothetical protein